MRNPINQLRTRRGSPMKRIVTLVPMMLIGGYGAA
jgi:hypothetical protein